MIIHETGSAALSNPFVLFGNLATSALVAGNGSEPGFSPSAVLQENTWEVWKGSSLTSSLARQFTLDAGGDVQFDTLCIAAHNFKGNGSFTTGTKVYPTSNPWSHPWPRGVEVLTSGAMAFLWGAMQAAGQAFIWSQGTITQKIVLGYAAIGKRLVFPGWIGPDFVRPRDAVVIEGEASLSIEGQYLGATIRRKAGRLSVPITPLPKAWADENLPAFRAHYDSRRPFFFSPGSAAFPNELIFCWRASGAPELRPRLLSGGRAVAIDMELEFYAD